MVTYEIKKSTPVHPFQRHWQFCVGSGHAALALRADYALPSAFRAFLSVIEEET